MLTRFAAGLVAPWLLSSCFVVTDLDRFEVRGPCVGNENTLRNFEFALRGFEQFREDVGGVMVDPRIILLVVSDGPPLTVSSIVILQGLQPDTDAQRGVVVNAVPPGPHRVMLFVDRAARDEGRGLPQDDEPSWIRPLCPGAYFDFTADTTRVSLTEMPPAFPNGLNPSAPQPEQVSALRFFKMGAHTAGRQKLELALVHPASTRTVAWFRGASVDTLCPARMLGEDPSCMNAPPCAFTIPIPGVVVPGETYRADFFADVSQDNTCRELGPTGVPDDHTWSRTYVADAMGFRESFCHIAVFEPACQSFPDPIVRPAPSR